MARKKPPESAPGRYSALPHVVHDSPAYMGASYPAKALLCELVRQHSGSNNGHLQLATSWLKKRGWASHDVTQRAKNELVERQLIVKTKLGGLNAGCDLWALTWLTVSNFVGLDLRREMYLPGAWSRFVDDPAKQKERSGSRDSTIPADGMVAPSTVPAAGTETALFQKPAIPADGNNVFTNVLLLKSTTKRIVGKAGKSGISKHCSN